MKKILDAIAGVMLVTGLVVSGVLIVNAAASADPGPQVCSGTHLFDATGPMHTYTAPEGMLVSGYCVKAGSVQQGNGPVYVTVDPPQKSVTITHPSGKDISHYSVTLVPVETEPTETPTTPTETPTQPTETPTSTPPVVTEPPVTETPVVPTTEATPEIGWPEVEINCSKHKCTKTTKDSETGEVIESEEIVYGDVKEEGL